MLAARWCIGGKLLFVVCEEHIGLIVGGSCTLVCCLCKELE